MTVGELRRALREYDDERIVIVRTTGTHIDHSGMLESVMGIDPQEDDPSDDTSPYVELCGQEEERGW